MASAILTTFKLKEVRANPRTVMGHSSKFNRNKSETEIAQEENSVNRVLRQVKFSQSGSQKTEKLGFANREIYLPLRIG